MMSHAISRLGASALMLQGASDAAPASSPFSIFIPMGIVLVIFYFLLIRPANKKQKALQEMINNLKNGDQIVTTGGLHGTVAGISEDIIQLKIAPNVKVEISRSAVAALHKGRES